MRKGFRAIIGYFIVVLLQNSMARLRLPGRAGYKTKLNERTTATATTSTNVAVDPTEKFIENVHKGLMHFYDVVGESDEEEFDGFTEADVAQCDIQLGKIEAKLQHMCSIPKKDVSHGASAHTDPITSAKDKKRRKLCKESENIQKAVVKENRKVMERKGKGKRKPQLKVKLPLSKMKWKEEKDNKEGNDDEIDVEKDDVKYDISPVKLSIDTKEMKIKKTNPLRHKKTKIKSAKHNIKKIGTIRLFVPKKEELELPEMVDLKHEVAPLKREKEGLKFVLPSVSARSSRKIIPNKKFLEDPLSCSSRPAPKSVKVQKLVLNLPKKAQAKLKEKDEEKEPKLGKEQKITKETKLTKKKEENVPVIEKRKRKPSAKLRAQIEQNDYVDVEGDAELDIKDKPPEYCIICGDNSYRYWLKKPFCMDCPEFYRTAVIRVHQQRGTYLCKNNGHCIVNVHQVQKGKICKFCRYTKCCQLVLSPSELYKQLDTYRIHTRELENSPTSPLTPTDTTDTTKEASSNNQPPTEDMEVLEASNDATIVRASMGGPRIKHVFRRPATRQGLPAVFNPSDSSSSAAGPRPRSASAAGVSDDGMSLGGPNQSVMSQDGSVASAEMSASESEKAGGRKNKRKCAAQGPKKKRRCMTCAGCLAEECGDCVNCRDMAKNGGPGRLKKPCIRRLCNNYIVLSVPSMSDDENSRSPCQMLISGTQLIDLTRQKRFNAMPLKRH